MVIYGGAILAGCMLLGNFLGDLLGLVTGIHSNVGGVGFSMVLLMIITNFVLPKDKMHGDTSLALRFWRGMYIPVVVAMSASQNVVQALSAGPVAILAGILAVVAGAAMLPLLRKIGSSTDREEGEVAE